MRCNLSQELEDCISLLAQGAMGLEDERDETSTALCCPVGIFSVLGALEIVCSSQRIRSFATWGDRVRHSHIDHDVLVWQEDIQIRSNTFRIVEAGFHMDNSTNMMESIAKQPNNSIMAYRHRLALEKVAREVVLRVVSQIRFFAEARVWEIVHGADTQAVLNSENVVFIGQRELRQRGEGSQPQASFGR